MMEIAIVEDKDSDKEELQHMLNVYFSNKLLQYGCDTFSSGESFLAAFQPGAYDIIFLDIYMEGISGMETAKAIRRLDAACALLFVSTSYMHAVESYEVHAAYYLTKPISEASFFHAMDIVAPPLLKISRYLSASVKGGQEIQILLNDILYIDCLSRKTHVHLEDRQIIIDNPIASVLEVLSKEERFLSCNRNVIVNMDWVESVPHDEFLLKNQERVPIRQRGRGTVKKRFLAYSLKGLRKEEHP